MQALVFGGADRIGSAVAWDPARFAGADMVGIVGRSRGLLQKIMDWIDNAHGISAMAMIAGFSAAIASMLLGMGDIREKGIAAPEGAIGDEIYLKFWQEQEKRGITIAEMTRPSPG